MFLLRNKALRNNAMMIVVRDYLRFGVGSGNVSAGGVWVTRTTSTESAEGLRFVNAPISGKKPFIFLIPL